MASHVFSNECVVDCDTEFDTVLQTSVLTDALKLKPAKEKPIEMLVCTDLDQLLVMVRVSVVKMPFVRV